MSPLLLLALLGCSEPEPEPPDPRPAVERVLATLDEAVRLDKDKNDALAVAAWVRALDTFESGVEPWLRRNLDARDVVRLEYDFALIRSEIDQAKGKPAARVDALSRSLREAVGQSAS